MYPFFVGKPVGRNCSFISILFTILNKCLRLFSFIDKSINILSKYLSKSELYSNSILILFVPPIYLGSLKLNSFLLIFAILDILWPNALRLSISEDIVINF